MKIDIISPGAPSYDWYTPSDHFTSEGFHSYQSLMILNLRHLEAHGYNRTFVEPSRSVVSSSGWSATTNKHYGDSRVSTPRNTSSNLLQTLSVYDPLEFLESSTDLRLCCKIKEQVLKPLIKDVLWYMSHGCDIPGAVIEVLLSLPSGFIKLEPDCRLVYLAHYLAYFYDGGMAEMLTKEALNG